MQVTPCFPFLQMFYLNVEKKVGIQFGDNYNYSALKLLSEKIALQLDAVKDAYIKI